MNDSPRSKCTRGAQHLLWKKLLAGSSLFQIMSGRSEYKKGFKALLMGMMISPTGKYESVGISNPELTNKKVSDRKNFWTKHLTSKLTESHHADWYPTQ